MSAIAAGGPATATGSALVRCLEGTALHRGGRACVTLETLPDPASPVLWAQGATEVAQSMLHVVATSHGVRVATSAGPLSFDLVEHLLAAMAGLGVRSGVRVRCDDPELPLLDGGARQFCDALLSIGAPCGAPPALAVARDATIEHAGSTYCFAVSSVVEVAVSVDFPPPVGRQQAAWHGKAEDFVTRIAPARTFGWQADHGKLLSAGRAAAVDLRAVLAFGPDGPLSGCAPSGEAEPARHKLLDLIGDLGLHGGPPRGRVEATRPGHGATHGVVARALADGVLVKA